MEQGTKTTPAVETWVDIEGYEGLYQVSTLGRVRSLDRWQYNPVAATHQTLHKGHILNGVVSQRGYLMVGLRPAEGKRKNCSVHRLVAKAFIPNPDNLPFVNHKNYDQLDNRVENLEWCNEAYNVHYGRADQIRQMNQPKRKAVSQYTLDGAFIASYPTMTAAAKAANTHRALIRKCLSGEYQQAGGYCWRYSDI